MQSTLGIAKTILWDVLKTKASTTEQHTDNRSASEKNKKMKST